MTPAQAERKLAFEIAHRFNDPLGYVMYAFPWDSNPEIQVVELPKELQEKFGVKWGPDAWAIEFLNDLGHEIRLRNFNNEEPKPVAPIRFTTASGHGIGKSVMVAWLVKFIHDTRPYSRGTVTAVTDVQLRSKTWAEVAKWHNMSLTRHWSTYTNSRGSMKLQNRNFPETWYVQAQTSREENSESFAGQHAANSTSFYIFDEASGIPGKIFEVREGGLTDGEPMVFDFGNPTRNSGPFYDNTVGPMSHRYKTRMIDSRNVAITNKGMIEEWKTDHGEDSDFFRVRVKGQFPRSGSTQFIGTELVQQAMSRELTRDPRAPLVLGVDPARFGDDETVIYIRHGMDARTFLPRRYRNLDTVQVAGKVVEVIREFERLAMKPSAVFVDQTGLGAGVVDALRAMGQRPIGISSTNAPLDQQTYRYKSDEMWGNMKEAMMRGLCLPTKQDMSKTGDEGVTLQTQLTDREYDYTLKGQINLESKRDMKARGVGSPDVADALALTFAQDVTALLDVGEDPYSFGQQGRGWNRERDWDYNPLEARF